MNDAEFLIRQLWLNQEAEDMLKYSDYAFYLRLNKLFVKDRRFSVQFVRAHLEEMTGNQKKIVKKFFHGFGITGLDDKIRFFKQDAADSMREIKELIYAIR